jgi:hypothetical protein
LDPCAGVGNFPLEIAERLMGTLKDRIPDPEYRYKWIMEKMIYMIEIQPRNAYFITHLFTDGGRIPLNLNLKVCDTLSLDMENMKPSDWKDYDEIHRTCYRFKHIQPKRGRGRSVWQDLYEEASSLRTNSKPITFQLSQNKKQSLRQFLYNKEANIKMKTRRVNKMSTVFNVELSKV